MLNILIKAVFSIITKLFALIFSPFISLITVLFPSLATYFNYISSFLVTALTYVRTCLSLLLIDDTMIMAIFDYFAILYSIYLISIGIKFAFTIYQKLKP